MLRVAIFKLFKTQNNVIRAATIPDNVTSEFDKFKEKNAAGEPHRTRRPATHAEDV